MIRLPEGIRENLRFLIIEVDTQLARLQDYFDDPDQRLAQRIYDRTGYLYNLKMRIHRGCLRDLSNTSVDSRSSLMLRGTEMIASDLERIVELGRDCIKQMGYLKRPERLQKNPFARLVGRVRRGVEMVEPALQASDTSLALKIGQIEEKLDRHYNKLRKQYMQDLRNSPDVEDYTCALFVAQRIEQMGDALLDISESIISTSLGQPLNIDRYFSLQSTVAQLESDNSGSTMQIEPIAETRSGSSISAISINKGEDEDYVAIFKDGEKRKLKEERQGVESWHEIYPGLAPKILSYKKRGESAALLIEHLPGLTFEQILLHESAELLEETMGQLGKTLLSVWQQTRQQKQVAADYMGQMLKRMPEVYSIHPDFSRSARKICGYSCRSFEDLARSAQKFERDLKAPFAVYIHGDFNVDNIIYDHMERRINFIDLHRSRYMDYVQDISVFMVSNYRLQVMDLPLRRRIARVALQQYQLARGYAQQMQDETFELRLGLGLARSFATSTRFILDQSLSRAMFLRARYLLETVLACKPEQREGFRLPLEEIFLV